MMRFGRSKPFRERDEEVVLRLNLNGVRDRRKHQQQNDEQSKKTSKHHRDERRQDDHSTIASRWSRASPHHPPRHRNESMMSDAENRELQSPASLSTSSEHHSLNSNFTGNKNRKNGEENVIQRLIIDDLWSDNPAIVEKGLKKLSGIVGTKKTENDEKSSREIIFRAGGHLAIVQAMKKHKTSEAVQKEGCRALGIAAEEIIDTTSHDNAIATVQDFGCGALQNLTGAKENSKLMIEKEGLAILLTSMKTFPKSVNVQESACWTIVNLCLRKENRSKLEKAKCLSTVASVIDNHPKSPQLKVAAQEALQHLLSLLISERDE